MIFFVPGYDPATYANMVVAALVVLEGEDAVRILGEQALRPALLAALSETDEKRPLFAMSHGYPDHLVAQDGEPALTEADVALLEGRAVFAFACHTASVLGEAAAGHGAVWWGYTGAITAPDVSAPLVSILRDVFAWIRGAFAEARSTSAREAVLHQLADRCQEAERRVDELLELDTDLDVGTAYLCLLQIWQRLRVWEEGARTPLSHPSAPPPLLF